MHSLRNPLVTLLAALLVLLPGGASARTQYLCHVMGRVMPSCCCETEQQASDSSPDPQLRSEGCCEFISSPGHAAMPRTCEKATKLPGAAFVAVVPEPLRVTPSAPQSPRATTVPQTRAPPALGPPLFLAHCALLI